MGWMEIPSVLALMTLFLNKLSVTIGMVPVFGDSVPARRRINKVAQGGLELAGCEADGSDAYFNDQKKVWSLRKNTVNSVEPSGLREKNVRTRRTRLNKTTHCRGDTD
jgi:hypothetical protein